MEFCRMVVLLLLFVVLVIYEANAGKFMINGNNNFKSKQK